MPSDEEKAKARTMGENIMVTCAGMVAFCKVCLSVYVFVCVFVCERVCACVRAYLCVFVHASKTVYVRCLV